MVYSDYAKFSKKHLIITSIYIFFLLINRNIFPNQFYLKKKIQHIKGKYSLYFNRNIYIFLEKKLHLPSDFMAHVYIHSDE